MPSPRITLIHRYFWPDAPPYASMLRSIAGQLARDGVDVRVLTAQPSYLPGQERRARRELVDGIVVERVPALSGSGVRRVLDLFAFPAAIATRIVFARQRPDVVMCSTVPQVTLGVATAAAARLRRAKFIYHCMDLHPEIGRLSGEFANPVVFRFLAAMDRWTMRRADRIVVLSEDMRRTVTDRDPRLDPRVVVLNNFSLPDFEAPAPSPLPRPNPGVLRMVFTGNIGRFQGLEDLVDALSELPNDAEVEMVFMGDGKARGGLEGRVRGLDLPPGVAVRFVGHGPVSAAKALMASAHLGVVSLMPDVVKYAFPSKMSTYAEAGLPLLVICEPDTELARTTIQEELGWSVGPGDRDGMAEAILVARNELTSGKIGDRSERVRAYARAHFAELPVLNRWRELMTAVLAERDAS